jgi:MEMO1 family protein
MQDTSKAKSNAAIRPMLCAGGVYPKQANVLKRELNRYLASIPNSQSPINFPRGILSPHIDYVRGGAAYAAAWKAVQPAAQQADLAIILGTDHRGAGQLFTLTHQSYATPYGVLPTAHAINQSIAQAIGPQRAYAGEMFHAIEHSIELPLVWLHHMREGAPIDVLPVIVGGFWDEMQRRRSPTTNAQVIAFLSALKNAIQGHNVIVIASGDLSHVGPAFDGPPLSEGDKADLQAYDQTIVQHIVNGDAESWFAALAETHNATNVCGLAPVYLTLKLIEPSKGQALNYAMCPADEQNTSVVSVCGAVLS